MSKGAQPNITLCVQNPTDCDIILTGRVVISRAQSVTSVHPLSTDMEAHSPSDVNNIQAQHAKDQYTSTELWDPPIDLSPVERLSPIH